VRNLAQILAFTAMATLSAPLAANAICMPSQGCGVTQMQQQSLGAQQRQLDSQRAAVRQNQQDLQRARTKLLQTRTQDPRSQANRLQRLEQQKAVRDAHDNVLQSQRDLQQMQSNVNSSRNSLIRPELGGQLPGSSRVPGVVPQLGGGTLPGAVPLSGGSTLPGVH